MTSEQRLPLYNCQFFVVPRVVVVRKLDCNWITMKVLVKFSPYVWFCGKQLVEQGVHSDHTVSNASLAIWTKAEKHISIIFWHMQILYNKTCLMWSLWAQLKVISFTKLTIKCNHIKRIITLTSDNIQQLSIYFNYIITLLSNRISSYNMCLLLSS
jgi:hypothetical protein